MTLQDVIKNWEIKDRTYLLKGSFSPLTYRISTKGFILFDEDTKQNRQIRYADNQNSLFVDEQKGNVKLSHTVFEDGTLFIPRNKPLLQILLSHLHPKANKTWYELDLQKEALDDLAQIENEIEATQMAMELDIEHLEAIMRSELGSDVTKLSSKELKRDAYVFARNNPAFFIELANDEDIKLRNLANRAVEMGVIKLTDDNTVFKWAANSKKICTVPFDENPYSHFSQFLKTDDGDVVLKSIIKKLG